MALYHALDDTGTHALCSPSLRFTPPEGFVMEEYAEPDVKPDEMCPECRRAEER